MDTSGDNPNQPLLPHINKLEYKLEQKVGQVVIHTNPEGINKLKAFLVKSRQQKNGFFMIFDRKPRFNLPWSEPDSVPRGKAWYKLKFDGTPSDPSIALYFHPRDGVRVDVWLLKQWCTIQGNFRLRWNKDSVTITGDNTT